MALFFDRQWFDERLRALSRTKTDLAEALGLTRAQIDDMWKDQREVRAADVTAMAEFFCASAAEIADRCGAATPEAPEPGQKATTLNAASLIGRLDSLDERMRRLEHAIAELKHLILSPAMRDPHQGR